MQQQDIEWKKFIRETYLGYQNTLRKLEADLKENEDFYMSCSDENYFNYDRYIRRKFDIESSIKNIKNLQKFLEMDNLEDNCIR